VKRYLQELPRYDLIRTIVLTQT